MVVGHGRDLIEGTEQGLALTLESFTLSSQIHTYLSIREFETFLNLRIFTLIMYIMGVL